ncbi:MAG TPA: hypothetical protein VJW23_08685, partial [Propionibacteriaceae bacterium]|nr:hypothetical protein [Propionibacteriaceae bacterium]
MRTDHPVIGRNWGKHSPIEGFSPGMQSIVAETPVSASPVGAPSASLLAARDDPDVVLREQTAAALVSQRLPIIVLGDSAEGTQAVGSHDLRPDRALLLLVRSASHDSADAIDLALKAGDSTWAARAIVRSLAIPRILAGADDDVLR